MPFFFQKQQLKKISYILLAAAALLPFVSSPIALVAGMVFALLAGNPFDQKIHPIIQVLLKVAIVGLGFVMNATEALAAGKSGFLLTVFSIFTVLVSGYVLAKLFRTEAKISYLITVGTAICGGSAIAAVSPLLKPDNRQISLALSIVFLLNSIALFIYPPIGNLLHLSQQEFGLWAAAGIHDTSSVVGAAAKYGTEALKTATTVKLLRSLWIIPLSLFTMWISREKDSNIKIPWFIGLFILSIAMNSLVPALKPISPYIVKTSKAALNLTLFLIGSTITVDVLKTINWKPLVMAIILWIIVSFGSLLFIIYV